MLKDIGKFIGDTAGFFAHPLVRGYEKTQAITSRRQDTEMNQQLQILQGDFSDEEKENAARIIIQAVQPKFYEHKLQQDPSAKFYQKQPDAMSPSQQLNQLELQYLSGLPVEERNQIIRQKMTKPLVSIGGQPWRAGFLGQEAMGAEAEAEHKAKMGLSEAQRNTARKSVKTIVSEMSTRLWTWGTKNYARSNLIQGYKQYRTENDYASTSKSAEHRKWLDKNWDDQMTTYNKAGYKKIGKDEFDWDPKDPKVQELRKEPKMDNRDYFSEVPAFEGLPQAATPDFPEENIPKTFEQLGITQPQDQQIFQEMQKALPDRDMRQEYENDPEGMKRLMKLWQEKKLNKKNLHKAFSAIQQRARQSLGIT